MHISCSVVCYRNTPIQIAQVLKSLAASGGGSPPLEIRVTLIDNSPTNKLAEVAREFNAAYIHLPQNPGFGAAHNLAIAESIASNAQYHLVLNPDTHFAGNVIPALVAYLEEHHDVGLIMPDIRYPDGSQQHLCKLLPAPYDLLMRRFSPKLYECSGRLARYELHESGYNKLMNVPALSGCFMLLRAAVLREVGGFDERFFMYLEDVDLSRRIGRIARTVYFPYVSITHEYVKGSYRNWKLTAYHICSAIRYFNKWGWFSDREKKQINNATLREIKAGKGLERPAGQA
ncbi:MAG: glycosyltransferase family 2 protein [Noviherbaspirillum sp.]|jgi:GT2 family glycosyltransferase|nr:glycosyltransferase family 2 protein [Noviherbaspirillum sp.]